MQLNVVNAEDEPRVRRVLSMRVVVHVVASVACVRKENLCIYSLHTGTMATEGEGISLVDGVTRANVSRDELREMLRAAVREAPTGMLHTCVIIGTLV